VSMHRASPPTDRRSRSARRARSGRAGALHIALPMLLGLLAALLVACGGSSKGLIPTGDAGPLQSDFEAVAHAAESGNGDCGETERALLKTDQDFAALPASIDAGLHTTLRQGIENLRTRALALCAQPLPQSTVTTTTPKTTSTTTTTPPAETQTTTTQTTPTTTAPPSPSGPGGGTPAPGEGTPGAGSEEAPSESNNGGVGGAKVLGPQEGGK
jgi:hypothetical protein